MSHQSAQPWQASEPTIRVRSGQVIVLRQLPHSGDWQVFSVAAKDAHFHTGWYPPAGEFFSTLQEAQRHFESLVQSLEGGTDATKGAPAK